MKEYNGKRFSYKNYNCFDHIQAVRRDNGLSTHDYHLPKRCDLKKILALWEDCGTYDEVANPKDFDLVFFNDSVGHLGIYWKGFVSHCSANARCVTLDKISDFKGLRFFECLA